ncbi:MAG: VOC family protein [Novosphingobium sp.]
MGVLGFGGFFFRSPDPEAASAWYREHLNVGGGCSGTGDAAPDQWSWMAGGGPTVFAAFAADTDYFPADRQCMLNFRVSELGELLGKLRASGVEVETRAEWDSPDTGKFARIHDLDGNPIELWEPPA